MLKFLSTLAILSTLYVNVWSTVTYTPITYTPITYTSEALADQVIDLPGLNYNTKFNQFSGYINLENTQKNIHYWLVESEINPESAPVVFWTNGGPGCSGLIGFMTEQGPFKPDSDNNLIKNEWAWNKITNMVFVEQPIGVGFSYSDNKDDYKTNDDQSAQDNLKMILGFLQKFPHFVSNKNKIYITSESYGGHYMPTLAQAIFNYNEKQSNVSNQINFAGLAVGNPYVDFYSGTGAMMETYYNFNLLVQPMWQSYVDQGCTNPITLLNDSICSGYILKFNTMVGNINPYALEYPVCLTSQQKFISNKLHGDFFQTNFLSDQAITYEPCEEDYATSYLNINDVKKALHVKTVIEWVDCSTTCKYSTADRMKSTKHIYKELLLNKNWPNFRIMVYYGDVDGVCSNVYSKWLFDLGFSYSNNQLWNNWYVDGQMSGFITQFKTPLDSKEIINRFTYATVHNAGHEVPAYKPKEAFILFQAFINADYNI